jgi:transposase
MTAKRKQYTQEFKNSAVSLVTEQGYKLSEAARNLDINVSVLRRWKNAAERQETSKADVGSQDDLQAELVRLRKENKRLKMEREILKKATAFFAQDTGNGID